VRERHAGERTALAARDPGIRAVRVLERALARDLTNAFSAGFARTIRSRSGA
jgi:hypothetical protein